MKAVTKDKKSQNTKQNPKPRTLLQQLAQMPEKLFSGEFRQQYGALCFRWTGDDDAIEILVITSRGQRSLGNSQGLADEEETAA